MAETILYNIAGRLLGELGSSALQEIKLVWGSGAKAEFEKLRGTVSTIEAVLLDAQQKQATNHEVKDWLKKLEIALYDADDLLDDFSTEVLRRKVMSHSKVHNFFSNSNQIAFRLKMGLKVKMIREKLDAIATDRVKFHFIERQEEMRVENKTRETHSFVRAEEVVGREKDKNAIIELLLNSNVQEDVSIIPLVGIGGLGKTALAQLVYNDEKVKNHFELKMWVWASDVFDVKVIAKNIIESAASNKSKRIQMDGIKDDLKKQIDGKKYFLVLDDVWNEDPDIWMKLRELLVGGARGSKILLTTRTQLVAKIMGTVSPYLLSGLSESKSWSLFKQMAFEHGIEPQNRTLIAVGKEVVKKCAGVPLAIRTVGGLLRIKDTEKEWLDFKDKELSKIAQTERGIFSILKLSYDYLPPYLKRCFAYCSLFPKGHRIDKQTLIQLWIAQGFIRELSSEKQQPEDVGDQYFMDLLRRSFFQDVEKDYLGDVRSCKMHDLIHDLAQLIVGSESCTIGLDAKDVVARTRYVSVSVVVDTSWEVPTFLNEPNKLLTLLLPIQHRKLNPVHNNELTCNETISSFKRARVLDLLGLELRKVPSSIGESRHMRYLDLSNNCFKLLPKSICSLHNLQTLKLNGCKYLEELPRDTKNLVSLRHLEIEGCVKLSHMPRGLGQLTSLQTLTQFVVGHKARSTVGSGGRNMPCELGLLPSFQMLTYCVERSSVGFSGGLSELEGLVNLRGHLRIEGLRGSIAEETDPNHNYLARLEFLDKLSLFWNSFKPDESLFECLQPHRNLKMLSIHRYGGAGFPSWMMVDIGSYLPNMVQIKLSYCHRWQHLPPFGLLPSLQVLGLSFMDSLDYLFEEDYSSSSSSSSKTQGLFPSLRTLQLHNLKRLKGLGSRRKRRGEVVRTATTSSSLGVTPRHLTALKCLDIKGCPQLDLLADDDENGRQFQSLRTITTLSITNMPNLVSLPLALQCLTNLQFLRVKGCQNLVAFPEFIGNLTSLRKLQIEYCESLTTLPDSMCHLTALQDLTISGCAQLIERWQQKAWKDWPKIAHIPSIFVRGRNQKI